MTKKAKQETDKIKQKTIEDMTSLGVYKQEYNDIIEIYAEMISDYMIARREFDRSGRKYETETAAGNMKKSAIVDTIEKLRKDILAYSDRLCLNPKSIDKVEKDTKKSEGLVGILKELGGSG